jgi:hypothetical protein
MPTPTLRHQLASDAFTAWRKFARGSNALRSAARLQSGKDSLRTSMPSAAGDTQSLETSTSDTLAMPAPKKKSRGSRSSSASVSSIPTW